MKKIENGDESSKTMETDRARRENNARRDEIIAELKEKARQRKWNGVWNRLILLGVEPDARVEDDEAFPTYNYN